MYLFCFFIFLFIIHQLNLFRPILYYYIYFIIIIYEYYFIDLFINILYRVYRC